MKPIYIVDDSADQRFLLEHNFKRYLPDIPVVFFDDARQLFVSLQKAHQEEIDRERPGVIVLDLNMPEMNGYQALTLLKGDLPTENQWWNAIPVVLNSSEASAEDIEKCYAAGANKFVAKSQDFSVLRNVLVSINH